MRCSTSYTLPGRDQLWGKDRSRSVQCVAAGPADIAPELQQIGSICQLQGVLKRLPTAMMSSQKSFSSARV